MNVWSDIIDALVEDKGLRELIIAPNAPPVSPRSQGRRVLGGRVFSAADVAETLLHVRNLASGTGQLGQAGVFCLGVRDVGRIRISYLTQRGSRAVRVVRIPFDVPTIDAVCAQPLQARELVQTITARRCKAVLAYGTSRMCTIQLVYALLDEINKTQREVIVAAEQGLSFLMTHDDSVVIQVEVPTDAPSLDDAIQQALLLEPDVVHMGDIRVTDDLPSLPQLINANACSILSTVSQDASFLLARLPKAFRRNPDEHGGVVLLRVRSGDDGRLHLDMEPFPPQKVPHRAGKE